MTYSVRILATERITRNVRRYTLERPDRYGFEPGQATEVSIDRDGWRERKSPFTFTSLPDWEHLEFTIKSYPDRHGVTAELWTLQPGDRLLLRDVWGTITYRGPGTFIAGGAGVTPFIAILRQLQQKGRLAGHRLIASHRTVADIILRDEFEAMPGLQTLWTVTDDPAAAGVLHQRIDETFLREQVTDLAENFYVCGPDAMVRDLRAALGNLGARAEALIWER